MAARSLSPLEPRRADRTAAAALGGAAFALYAAGACPTIYVGDSGELVAAVHTLGIPHPSGYPLYVLLGKLWTLLLPAGSIAHRMSLFSALCAALAVALVFLAARALGAARLAAATAAILFALSPSFWGEANVQRVYALNALFVALGSRLAMRWCGSERTNEKRDSEEHDDPDEDFRTRERRFVGVAFLCGLGAANHTFLAVWGGCFALSALVTDPGLLRRWRTLGAAGGAALLGLSVYAFLPLRSRQEPRLDWGNPESWEAFVAVVTRRDFWPRRWWSGWHDLPPILRDFFGSFAVELTSAGAAFALVGFAVALRRRRAALLFPLVALANVGVLAAHGSRSDLFLWHRYYLPAYLSASLLVALGLDRAARWARERSARLATGVLALALGAAAALAPLRCARFDRSDYRIAEQYSRTLLATLPPGAHLAASDDNILFVLIYLQLVEGVRPDVDLILQGIGGELPPLRFDPDREPLFFTHHPNWRFPALDVVPVGLVYRVVRAGHDAPLALPPLLRLAGEDDPRVPKDDLTRNLIGELHFMLGVTFAERDRARGLAELGEAARAAPDNAVLFYNLGLVYDRIGLAERALAAFERSAAIEPRPLPGPSRARALDKVAELRARLGRGGAG
jgi:tetratricopeptide (TPR) repeat protein